MESTETNKWFLNVRVYVHVLSDTLDSRSTRSLCIHSHRHILMRSNDEVEKFCENSYATYKTIFMAWKTINLAICCRLPGNEEPLVSFLPFSFFLLLLLFPIVIVIIIPFFVCVCVLLLVCCTFLTSTRRRFVSLASKCGKTFPSTKSF